MNNKLISEIVIPIFNEENILTQNINTLSAFFNSMIGENLWAFIFVDNGSTDLTKSILESYKENHPLTKILYLSKPNYGAALKTGLSSCKADWVFLLDIEQWDLLFLEWCWINRLNFDIFVGSKRADLSINHQTKYRRILSAGLNSILQILFGFSGTDTHGQKLLNLKSISSVLPYCTLDRGQFDTELILRSLREGLKIIEGPIIYKEFRAHRNLLLKKIIWNIFAIRRLNVQLKAVPSKSFMRYYKISRNEILQKKLVEF